MQQTKVNILKSCFLAGIVILTIVNVFLSQNKPLAKVDPESLPAAHTWVWWASKEYLAQNPAPNIVWLGSSLVMHPISRLDADFLGKNLDYVHHHTSQYMKQALQNKLGVKVNGVFNFSLPGGMVSDDYVVTRALFDNKHKPDIIILGLGVRDFMDNGVRCAGGTPAFRYLRRYIDISDILDLAMPKFFQRFDYLIGNYFYLWNKKLDLQVLLSEVVKNEIGPINQKLFQPSKLNEIDPSRNLPSNLKAEVEEGMFIVQSKQPYSYEDNSKEYIKRYRSPNEKMFAIQKEFLNKLLQMAEERQIKVVLVNMPVTDENHKLMPSGVYDKYLDCLTKISVAKHIPFIDLDAGGKFDKQNFYDTAHMNASGGKKLVDIVVAEMSKDDNIAAVLNTSVEKKIANTKEATTY